MAEVVANKDINTMQLQYELSQITGYRSSHRSVAPEARPTNDWLITVDDVDQADLQTAVDNHVADPNWVNPDREAAQTQWEQAIQNANSVAELKDAILGAGSDAKPNVDRRPSA